MKRNFKKFLTIILSLFVLWSVVYAATDFTTDTKNYKNNDYRDWQQVVCSDGYVFSRKSAWWNDAAKTEATVKIELQTKEKTTTETIPGEPGPDDTTTTLTFINNADILFICDVSKSAYEDVKLDKSTIENEIVAPAARSLLEGKYAGVGNAVAFCEFAQGIFLYGKNSSNPATCSYIEGTPKGSYSTGNRRGSRADGEAKYNATYNALVSSLDTGKAKFYTNPDDIEKVIKNAGSHNFGDTSIKAQNKYTNIDAALLYANYLKNNRSDTSRKMYVIIISDGAPDPIALYSGSNRTSLDGMMTSSSASWGTNPGTNSNRQWLLQLKYPFNMLYHMASSNFRSGGNEIFFIKTGTDGELTGNVINFWKNHIVGDSSHIKELSSESKSAGKKAVKEAIDDIRIYLDTTTTVTTTTTGTPGTPDQVITKPVAFSCKVIDTINYDLFEIVPNSWSKNIGSVSYDANSKKITWTISGINYGDNFGSKASVLTFKIKLNAAGLKKYGYLNTNYIKDVDKSKPDDTNCKITDTPEPTKENFNVPSPWLPRPAPTGTVIERYIKVTGNGVYTELYSEKHENVSLGAHEYKKQKDYSDLIYDGYKIETGLISSYSFKKGETFSKDTPSVTLTEDSLNYIITHVFETPPDYGLKFLHYDLSREQYITPGDTLTRNFTSLLSVLEKWFNNDENARNSYYNIVKSTDDNAVKVSKILELIKSKWNEVDFPAIKSLYTANYVNGKLSFTGSIDLRIDTGSSSPLSSAATANGVQYYPTFDSVKDAVSSKTGQIKDGSNIIITFYYVCNREIRVNHLDVDTNQLIGVPYNPELDYLRVGSEKIYKARTGKLLDNGDSYYSFYNKNKVNSNVGTSNANIDGTSSEVKVTSKKDNFLLDVNIDFFYKKWWKVSVYYKDIEDPAGNLINPKIYYKEQHDNTTENFVDLTNYKQDGLDLHYRYKYVDAKMGNDVKASQNPAKTITINDITNTVEIIFWYKKLPTITTTIEPETEYELGDPSDPTNPFNKKADEEIIVLDDLFTIKMDVDRYKYGEPGSTVVVSLPFDVYAKADAANERPTDGKFFKAATELLVDDFDPAPTEDKKVFKYTFRLPSWVLEKIYSGSNKETMCHTVIYGPNINEDGSKEVIDEKWIKIRVIGRLYDFTVTNLEGDDKWSNSLFNGANRGKEYKADTLPIGQYVVNSKNSTLPYNTSNIRTQDGTWKYGMKLGSKFLFSINTKGLVSDQIHIVPKLVYFDKNGNVVNNVTFVYNQAGKGEVLFAGTNGLVDSNVANFTNDFSTQLTYSKRYNAEVTSENNKANVLKPLGEKIPNVIRESNVSIRNAYTTFMQGKVSKFGKYNDLKLPNTLRIPYANYASTNTALSEVQKIGVSRVAEQNNVLKYINTSSNSEYMTKLTNNGSYSVNLNENQIVNSLGHWYAEYKLPATLKVKNSSNQVLKEGYIVVEFNISSDGYSGGKWYKYLSYMSQLRSGNIKYNQWYLENEHITQTNANASVPVYFPQTTANPTGVAKTINISSGYYPVAIYDVSISTNDDAEAALIH